MGTIKSFTDIPQSKTLSKILSLESADMIWVLANPDLPMIKAIAYEDSDKNNKYYEILPAWSLAALRNFLPVGIKINENTYLFESHNTFDKYWVYRYYNENDTSYLYCKNINEVDAAYEMILKLNEQNLL